MGQLYVSTRGSGAAAQIEFERAKRMLRGSRTVRKIDQFSRTCPGLLGQDAVVIEKLDALTKKTCVGRCTSPEMIRTFYYHVPTPDMKDELAKYSKW